MDIKNDNSSEYASPTRSCRILLVDEHPLLRAAIRQLFQPKSELIVCGECSCAQEALSAMRQLKPDLLIVEISLPGTNGIELTKAMLAERPTMKVLVLSKHDETIYALRALRAGALGYLMKSEDPSMLLAAVEAVRSGEIFVSERLAKSVVLRAASSLDEHSIPDSPIDTLSDRELEVFQLLGKRLGTREIAQQLHISVKTVETHRAHIKAKLGCSTSYDLVQAAVEWEAFSGSSS